MQLSNHFSSGVMGLDHSAAVGPTQEWSGTWLSPESCGLEQNADLPEGVAGLLFHLCVEGNLELVSEQEQVRLSLLP